MNFGVRARFWGLGALASAIAAGCGGSVVYDGGGGGADGFKNEGGASPSVVSSNTSVVSSNTSSVSNVTSVSSSSSSSSSSGQGGAPPIPPLVEVDLGMVNVNTAVTFDVPPGMLGITAVAATDNPYDVVGFASLKAPDATTVVSNYGIPGTLTQYINYGIMTVAAPQTDAPEEMPLMPGVWSVTVGDQGAGTDMAHVSVWMRQTLDGAFHGGLIDVNIYAIDGVASDDYIKAALVQAFSGYVGLDLGTVQVLPLSSEFAVVDENNFYDALEATAGAPGKPALNILAVTYLSGELEGAAGVTPGAPAMPLYHGTHQSGIFWMVIGDLFVDEMILKHETGHLTGLFHTSEFEPGYGDALADTPLCPDVNAQLDACPDYDNLMFPTGGDGTLHLSAKQQVIMRASTLYRGIVRDGGGAAEPLDGSLDNGGAREAGPWTRVATEPPVAASAAPWAEALDPKVASWLGGVGCPAPGSEYYATLASLGGNDLGALVGVAGDDTAPAWVRQRALVAAGRAGATADELASFAKLAKSRGAPRAVRLGALRAVNATDPALARSLAMSLGPISDPALEAAVRRIAR